MITGECDICKKKFDRERCCYIMSRGPTFIGNERIDLDLCEECNEKFKNKEREIANKMHEFYINELKSFIKNKDINIEEESE